MLVRPTRRTQPLRKRRGRPGGPALSAAQKGKPRYLRNPQDVKRKLQRQARKRRRRRTYTST